VFIQKTPKRFLHITYMMCTIFWNISTQSFKVQQIPISIFHNVSRDMLCAIQCMLLLKISYRM